MSSFLEADTVVLGAGPAGMACACEAAAGGQRLIILDRKADPTQVHPGIAGVLHDLSMPFDFNERTLALSADLSLDLSRRITKRLYRIVLMSRAGSTEFRHPRPLQYYMDLSQILAVYWRHLEGLGQVVTLPAHRWSRLLHENRQGRLQGVEVQGPQGSFRIRGRHFVIADGINSNAFTQLGIERRSLGLGIVLSQWVERQRPDDFEDDELRLYLGPPYLDNPRSLGIAIPFPERVQYSTLTHVPPGADRERLREEFRDFVQHLVGFHAGTQSRIHGDAIDLHLPLSSCRIGDNALVTGDAAWAVEIYFRGAIEAGWRLGQALAISARSGSGDALHEHDRWFNELSRRQGARELQGLMLLAELAEDGDTLPALLATLAGRKFGPCDVAPSLLTLLQVTLRFLTAPLALGRAALAYRRLTRHMAPWSDAPQPTTLEVAR